MHCGQHPPDGETAKIADFGLVYKGKTDTWMHVGLAETFKFCSIQGFARRSRLRRVLSVVASPELPELSSGDSGLRAALSCPSCHWVTQGLPKLTEGRSAAAFPS